MRPDWPLIVTAGVLTCLGTGVAAGLDAGGRIDDFYTTPRVRPERLPPMPQSSPYDWDQPPPSSTNWASATEGQSMAIVGGERADGSNLAALDRAVERASAVRIHRPRHVRVERTVIDEPVDIDPPAEPSPAT